MSLLTSLLVPPAYISPTFTGTVTVDGKLIAGDPGTEESGINIGGVTYESTFKVSDIDGTNYAQTILHRHSTILEPLIVGARSNSDTSSHADVTTGQNLFTVYAAGWAGSNYKLFGSEAFSVGTGTVSNTSSPGKWTLSVTPDGSTAPLAAITIDSDKSATFTGDVDTQYATFLTPINDETGTTYTFSLSDFKNGEVVASNASASTYKIPQVSTTDIPVGGKTHLHNKGVGAVTLVKEGSDLLIGNTLVNQNATAEIIKVAESAGVSTYVIFGGTAVVNRPAISSSIISITTSQTKLVGYVQANCTLLGIFFQCFSIGTAGTFKLQLNGADITGLTSLVPVTAGNTASCSAAVNLVRGDKITIVADGTLATIADLLIAFDITETF